MRTSDAIKDKVMAEKWRGGNPSYGYKHVSKGTLNRKGKPIFDVEIDPEQAEVVRTIFRLARDENMGGVRIARYLNDNDIPAQEGGKWQSGGIYLTLKNPIYKGIFILHSHSKTKPKVVSPPMEQFRIISDEEWDKVQAVTAKRKTGDRGGRRRNHPKHLLSGLAFCGNCGSKLAVYSIKHKKRGKKNRKTDDERKYNYICKSISYPETGKCTGQTTFGLEKLEAAVVSDIKEFIAALSAEDIADAYAAQSDADARQLSLDLTKKRAAVTKAETQLDKLKGEIVKILTHESSFSETTIKELLLSKEAELSELRSAEKHLQSEMLRRSNQKNAKAQLCNELENWPALFDKHDLVRRRAMLNNIIDRVDVWADRVEITYDIKLDAFGAPQMREAYYDAQHRPNQHKKLI